MVHARLPGDHTWPVCRGASGSDHLYGSAQPAEIPDAVAQVHDRGGEECRRALDRGGTDSDRRLRDHGGPPPGPVRRPGGQDQDHGHLWPSWLCHQDHRRDVLCDRRRYGQRARTSDHPRRCHCRAVPGLEGARAGLRQLPGQQWPAARRHPVRRGHVHAHPVATHSAK